MKTEMPSTVNKTDSGAYQPPEAERIHNMFASVADNYDRANTVMSMGIHHLWRRKLVKWSGACPGQSVLDCATGTGDLALEFKRVVGPLGRVVGTDFCEAMLSHAPLKARRLGLDVEFSQADVLNLPFADHEFDFATIAFGIRNVENPARGLSELARVVKPGGYVIVLEFGQPNIFGLGQLYDIYAKTILPRLGGWLTGDRPAYEYLQQSSSQFPCGLQFVQLMKRSASFSSIECRALNFGIAYIYKARVS